MSTEQETIPVTPVDFTKVWTQGRHKDRSTITDLTQGFPAVTNMLIRANTNIVFVVSKRRRTTVAHETRARRIHTMKACVEYRQGHHLRFKDLN